MKNISISTTFKKIAFSLVCVFFVAMISNLLLKTVMDNENTAMWISVGVGLGTGIIAYNKFNTWFGGLE